MSRKYTSLPYIEEPVADGNFGYDGRLPIKTIVLHTTDGSLQGTLGWFNNPASQVSSNYVVDTDGKIYAMLEEYYVPYTNGNYQSNQESITIEFVDNNSPIGGHTEVQYQTAKNLCREIAQAYNLPIDRNTIKGHREIPPYTHPQCPGDLDLDRIAREANPTQPANYAQAAKDSAPFVFGYKTQGTVTQRMAKIIDAFKRNGITK